MEFTCHSETGTLKSVFLKKAEDAFVTDALISEQWKNLNYTGKPDFATAVREYENFETLLKKHGVSINYFPIEETVSMDSIYCRDAAIATNAGMILCNMGKAARVPEPAAQRLSYEKSQIRILGEIVSPGTVEGGDVAWLDEHTLAVGITYRTNAEGIRQLRNLLTPIGVELITASLPHYRGPADVFHLMSILSPVDKDLAVVYSPLMPVDFRNLLLNRGYRFVEVPDAEFESMGCNVLALAPRVCLMVSGNPQTGKSLEDAGCTVYEYEGNEISVKGGGGPTCLTRPVLREKR